MLQFKTDFKPRLTWFLGILAAWTLLWAVFGIHQAILSGSHPHPFLPETTLRGPLLKAVADWALGAWASNAFLGFLWGLLLFAAWMVQRKGPSPLGFRAGLWQGAAAILLVHGLLFWQVPSALGTLPLLCHLPMGLVLMGFFAGAILCLARGFGARRNPGDWGRLLGGALAITLVLQLPHDLFRRSMPRPPLLDPGAPRLLVYSIDGCRKDVLEKLAPGLAAPEGVVPIVAIPATRITWNLLLGGPPESLTRSFVIPYQREWSEGSPARLLEATTQKGLSTCFLIDDSSTLSFGLTRAQFTEVLEPRGGWTHYFSVGAGTCWPVHSWLENFLSPVETTNPWSDLQAYHRDVERALQRHSMVFCHTCQLHAPVMANREELQALPPWRWLLHPAYAYRSYQTIREAMESGVDRQDGRSNPQNSYRLRLQRLLRLAQPQMEGWSRRYPALSGVLTADHGEAFPPVVTPDGTLRNYLTGIHGFTLAPDTILVPLHPFGRTRTQDLCPGAFSWYDLRQCLADWVDRPGDLRLKQVAPEGWRLSLPAIQPAHTQAEGAGISPALLAGYTILDPSGIWFMSNPPAALSDPLQCRALVSGPGMVTFNPLGPDQWNRSTWKGYDFLGSETVRTDAMEKELAASPCKRPEKVFPSPSPAPQR